MFEKLIPILIEKIAPIGLLLTLFITIGITVIEVKYFQLSDSEEIILYFFFTFLFAFFIFLLIAKIIKLSNEIPIIPVHEEPQGEQNE